MNQVVMMMSVTVLCRGTEMIRDGEHHEPVQVAAMLFVGFRAQRKEKGGRKKPEMMRDSNAAAGRLPAAEGSVYGGASGRARTWLYVEVGLP